MTYDTKAHQHNAGRPTHALYVRVPRQLHEQLEQLATQHGDTVASVVRAMLRNGVERREAVQQ